MIKIDISKYINKFIDEANENINILNEDLFKLRENPDDITLLDELMRVAHTIKGTARMVKFSNIEKLTHKIEDIFNAVKDKRIETSDELIVILTKSFDQLSIYLDSVKEKQSESEENTEIIKKLERVLTGESADKVLGNQDFIIKKSNVISDEINELDIEDDSIDSVFEENIEDNSIDSVFEESIEDDSIDSVFEESIEDDSIDSVFEESIEDEQENVSDKNGFGIDFSELSKSAKNHASQIYSKNEDNSKGENIEKENTEEEKTLKEQEEKFEEKVKTTKDTTNDIKITESDTKDKENQDSQKELTKKKTVENKQKETKTEPKKETEQKIPKPTKPKNDLKTDDDSKKKQIDKVKRKKTKKAEKIQAIKVPIESLNKAISLSNEMQLYHLKYQVLVDYLKDIDINLRKIEQNIENAKNVDEEQLDRRIKNIKDSIDSLDKESKEALNNFKENNALASILLNDLQGIILQMRLVPLSFILDAFPRMVFDISRSLNKEVKINIQGKESELDKEMIEKIHDPLVHIIRNGIDHGIESPEERKKLGKDPVGKLEISSTTEQGNMIITISDDGKGIDIEKITEKAIKKGLIKESQIEEAEDSDLISLIFHPGFSTNDEVSDISGRGVGLDIVQNNIEEMKGKVIVNTELGKGTVFKLIIPLSLTAINGLIVSSAGKNFVIPSNNVEESLKLKADEIASVLNKRIVIIRNQSIPVYSLSRILDVPGYKDDSYEPFLIILNFSGSKIGITIEDILEQNEIVQKPLPYLLQKNKLVSGVTFNAKSEVVCILNIPELITRASAIREIKRIGTQRSQIKRKTFGKIMVVEDSPYTRDIEKTILETAGYEVVEASDGIDAMEKLKNEKVQLIVSDLEMPRMDGFTFIENIKRQKVFKDIPVIFISTKDEIEILEKAKKLGASAYIIKSSFEEMNLIENVNQILLN